MASRTPTGPPPPPVVQRIRLRYAKRGRLRFTSHRDFARAFERALRRAQAPMAYSAGFSPHPKISYLGASPTGVASEAEYVEIGLARIVDPQELLAQLDAALPPGLDLVEAVEASPGSLADRLQASRWQIDLAAVSTEAAAQALQAFLDRDTLTVERVTKAGRRTVDVRAAVLSARVLPESAHPDSGPGGAYTVTSEQASTAEGGSLPPGGADRAILELVVAQATPAVRPDDVLAALHVVAGLTAPHPPLAVRLAQGPIGVDGSVGDPLDLDRAQPAASS